MNTPHDASPAPLPFDHLVVMMRDQLEDQAVLLEKDGYRLTDLSVHNLGSMNRLITLDTTYIELLGWPKGQEPRRKEIAQQPLGLDALVFRMDNAQNVHDRLAGLGYQVNPVQALERELDVDGKTHTARFATLRFSEQPLPGLRLYFCQHLTPEWVWNTAVMHHPNGVCALHELEIEAPDAGQVATTLAHLISARAEQRPSGWLINLPNLRLNIINKPTLHAPRIAHATLRQQNDEIILFNPRLPVTE